MTRIAGQKLGDPTPAVSPLIRATNYHMPSSEELAREFVNRSDRVYIRFGNPTVRAAATALADLEGAESGLLFGSGMAAITTTLVALTRQGSHVVSQRNIFGQTFSFLSQVAAGFGVRTTFVDATDPARIDDAVTDETTLIYIETPSNPLLEVVDIQAAGEVAAAHGIPLIVDSTFATPVLQRPLSLGATLVVHSVTKYLGGHSDICAGAVLGPRPLIARIYEVQRLLGGIAEPDTAWLLQRSLKTLRLRVEKQSRSAASIASFIERAPGVIRVSYPTLVGSPGYETAGRQMAGGGGMVAFEVAGGLASARAVLDRCRVVGIATSLGGTDTIAEIPAELDFAEREVGAASGGQRVPEGWIRLSVGLEDSEAIVADLQQALQAMVAGTAATAAYA